MNNDILAGISGLFHSELPVSKAGGKSETGDFIALLLEKLGEEPANGISGESITNSRFHSFTSSSNINPLLSSEYKRPVDRIPDNQFKTTDRAETYHKKTFDNHEAGKSVANAADNSRSSDTAGTKTEKTADDKSVNNDQNNGQKSDQSEKSNKDRTTEAFECSDCEGHASLTDEVEYSELIVETTVETELQSQAIAADSILANIAGENTELVNQKSQEPLKTHTELQLDAETKAKIEELLNNLAAEELKALAETPEEFNQVLAELVATMPDSPEKNELQNLMDSPEFVLMLQTIAEQQTTTDDQAKIEANTSTTLATSEAESAETLDKKEEAKEGAVVVDGSVFAQSMNQTSDLQETAIADNSGNEASTTENNRVKDDQRENTKNTPEKNVETSQEKVASANSSVHNEESLREEFKQLNQSTNEANKSSESAETTDEPALTNKSNITSAGAVPATPEQAKTAVEEAAKKFFTLFAEKSAGSEKAASTATYSPEAVKRHSATNNNSAGNESNGFSSHTGTSASSPSAARPAAPTPAANHIFSQMLEKAEYLKTQNGSKILNMELDPGDLGKLEMELTSKDGTVTARISAESAFAKARLDELAPQIKEQLFNQGVNLTEITVDISSRNPDESNRHQMSGGKNRSTRILAAGNEAAEAIIRKNILPNLRRAALNIKAVDLTV